MAEVDVIIPDKDEIVDLKSSKDVRHSSLEDFDTEVSICRITLLV